MNVYDNLAAAYAAIFETDYRGFHGTRRVFGDFEYKATGADDATDQLGPGFYFTNNPVEAPHYGGSEEGANIRPALITINKPIILDAEEDCRQRPLTRLQVEKIISLAPDLEDRLMEHYDIGHIGIRQAISNCADAYTDSDLWYQIKMMWNDFYKWQLEPFARAVHKVVKYDGIIKQVTDDNIHYVAWFPSQIKPDFGPR